MYELRNRSNEMIGVLGHDFALQGWDGDNLGEWHEFCYESCMALAQDRLIYLLASSPRATTVPWMPPAQYL